MFGLAEQGRVSLTGCDAHRRAGRCVPELCTIGARGTREFPLRSWHDDRVHDQAPLTDCADVKTTALEHSATAPRAGVHKIGCGRCGHVQRAGERRGSADMRVTTQNGEHSGTLANDMRQGVTILEQVIVKPWYAARNRGMVHHDHMAYRSRLTQLGREPSKLLFPQGAIDVARQE